MSRLSDQTIRSMKAATSIPLVAALIASCGGSDTPDVSAATYTSPAGDFLVAFPEEPEITSAVPPELGGAERSQFTVVSEVGYQVVRTDFSDIGLAAEDLTDDDVREILEGERDSVVAAVGGTLTSSDVVEVDGHPGIAFEFRADPLVAEALVVWSDLVLYAVTANGPSAPASTSRTHADFVESFTIVGRGDR